MLKKLTKYHIVLGIIFIIGFALRIILLGDVPNGMQQDETSIGYNAYSISQTGKDEHGKSYPLYFKAFGEYKLPGYIYIDTLFIKLFGLSAFTVRLPSAIFGALTIVGFYLLIKQIAYSKHNEAIALLSAGLLAINPWHLHYSRGAFEVTIALFFVVYGVYLLLKGISTSNKIFLILSAFFLSLSMYTYNITRLLTPMILLYVLYLYTDKKSLFRKNIIITVTAFIIFASPIAFTLFSQGGLSSTKGTIVFTSAKIQAELLEYRSYLVELPDGIERIFFNQKVLSVWRVGQNMASYISGDFFFATGSKHGNHGIGTTGQFYLFEIITLGFGIMSIYITSKKKFKLMAGWWLLSVFTASLTREAPHATRSFFLLLPMVVFSAEGVYFLYRKIASIKTILVRYAVILTCAGIVVYSIVNYFASYYIRFPVAYASKWRVADRNLSQTISEIEDKYDKIVIDKSAGFMYTSYLFYTLYPPDRFHDTVKWEDADSEGFSFPLSFGKFDFADKEQVSHYPSERVLYISNTDENIPDTFYKIDTVYYPKRPVVVSIGQEIIQFPVEDTAYYLFENKQ